MKFKEKDPIVSMEQWFPEKEPEIGIGSENNVAPFPGKENIGGIVKVQSRTDTTIQRFVFHSCYENVHVTKELDNSTFYGESMEEKEYSEALLVMHVIDGKKCFVSKIGRQHNGRKDECLVFLRPSDWIITYKSGRREVLTDKEKQERFE